MKVWEEEKPLGLSARQFAGFFKVDEILVVWQNLHGKGGSEEILSSFFKAIDNSQQLLIKDIVVVFGGGEGLGR